MTQEHPDSDRWWERKYKMAKFGAVVGVVSLIAGFVGGFYAIETIEPYVRIGVWFGFGLILTFVLPASAENIVGKIWTQ